MIWTSGWRITWRARSTPRRELPSRRTRRGARLAPRWRATLQAIAREAGTLPALTPSRDLWSGIAARIEAPVITLGPNAAAAERAQPVARTGRAERAEHMGRRAVFGSTRWLAAAAAALIVVTGSATYLATKSAVEREVIATRGGSASRSAAPAAGVVPRVTPAPGRAVASTGEDSARGEERREMPAARNVGARDEASSALVGYDREIGRLRSLVTRRRGDLDSATIAVIETNLKVIDQAIAQSRAALVRDPGSIFLNEQLNNVLGQKVEILRTAAMLSARS